MRVFLLLCCLIACVTAWASFAVTQPDSPLPTDLLAPYAAELAIARPYALAIAAFAGVSFLLHLLFGGAKNRAPKSPAQTDVGILSDSDLLFLEAAAAVAVADLKVVHSELRMITAMAEKFDRKLVAALTEDQVLPFLERAEAPDFADGLVRRMSELRGALSEEDKRSIIQTCLWLSIADLEPQDAEVKLLRRFMKALGASDESIAQLDVWIANYVAQLEALITQSAVTAPPIGDTAETIPITRPGA